MIKTDSLLYKIDQRLNKLSTNEHQQIQLEDKLLALNEAQLLLIKNKLTGFSVPNQMGMDAFKKRYHDLQRFVVDYDDGSLEVEEINEQLHEWAADLTKLDPKIFIHVDSYILADKGRCKDRIIWNNSDLLKHGDLKMVINNDNYKPSFEYQETFSSISSDKISVYTDGTFTPTKIKIMYLRYPAMMDKAGYINFDGEESSDVDCELDVGLEDELLNLTIRNLGEYTENSSAMQSSQFNTQTSE